MNDLRELYQQVILDHNKNPRNFREIVNATSRVEGYNPLCGDHYTIFLTVDGDTIKDVSFIGNGCAISMWPSPLCVGCTCRKCLKSSLTAMRCSSFVMSTV